GQVSEAYSMMVTGASGLPIDMSGSVLVCMISASDGFSITCRPPEVPSGIWPMPITGASEGFFPPVSGKGEDDEAPSSEGARLGSVAVLPEQPASASDATRATRAGALRAVTSLLSLIAHAPPPRRGRFSPAPEAARSSLRTLRPTG